MMQLNNQGSNNFARITKEVRDNFKEYLNFVQSSISLQDNVVNNTTMRLMNNIQFLEL